MRQFTRALFYGTLAAGLSTTLFAQRNYTLPSRPALPSTTAIGMGAVGGFHPTGIAGSRGGAVGGRGYYGGSYAAGSYPGGSYPAGNRRSNTSVRGRGDYRRVPYQYFFTPYYYPFLDYGSAPYGGAPQDQAPDPNAEADAAAQNAMGMQLARLTAEVQQLRYGSQPQAPAYPQYPDPPAPPSPPITVVLRSGEQFQIQNYAVMDGTLWDFSKQAARKIPVASIDLEASAKATAATGAEFPQVTRTP